MSDRIFVDADVLVAAHDAGAADKRAIAEQVLRRLWDDKNGVLSVLALQEFYAALVATASPVPRRAARELIDAYSVWPVTPLEPPDILAASEIEERHRLSFHHAMIVVAARKSRATPCSSNASFQPGTSRASRSEIHSPRIGELVNW